jgi:hypothetical protein
MAGQHDVGGAEGDWIAVQIRVKKTVSGRLCGTDGRALTPWFTRKKNGRLYRYYLPARENKEHAGASGLPRLPAAELEAAVLEQLRGILRAPGMVAEVVGRQPASNTVDSRGVGRCRTVRTVWKTERYSRNRSSWLAPGHHA